MYNHLIDTFRCVAEQGSYAKAAECLLMSPSNVLKQIRALETLLAVRLFERSNKGVSLTNQGKYFYLESYRLIELSQTILFDTRHFGEEKKPLIRIGSTPLNPVDVFNRIWQRSPRVHEFLLRFVCYPPDVNTLSLPMMKDTFTADVGFSSEPLLENKEETEVFLFDAFRLTCAVPVGHPLAKKDVLQVSDLRGETLLFPSRGSIGLTQQFVEWIRGLNLEIKVETPLLFYDIEVFNRCAEEQRILVSQSPWNYIHSGLVNLPVAWDWSVPCGLIWKKAARKDVLDFIAAFQEAAKSRLL